MDDSFNNVLEGTRQYFMGLPKQARDSTGQQMWPAGASNDEGTPPLSCVPTTSSRPSSTAAGLPPTPTSTQVTAPPRPPSEPLEPEPHIIHKATVMREAAEKRREQPEIEDEEEPVGALSPPSHIIRKPTPHVLPQQGPAPLNSSPSPVQPPSTSAHPLMETPEQIEISSQYRTSVHRVQTPTTRPPDNYTAGRQPDPYSASRPPESFTRYQYEATPIDNGRLSHGSSIPSPQPSISTRQSPQTYARLSSSLPQHSGRLSEVPSHNSAVLRFSMPVTQPPPPPNDRVPPIHHPQTMQPSKRLTMADSRSTNVYQRRESYANARNSFQYDRPPGISHRRYEAQQAYSSYRPSTPQLNSNLRMEKHHQVQHKHSVMDTIGSHYTTRPPDRAVIPPQLPENARIPLRADYPNKSSTFDSKSSYNYSMPSTSSVRYVPNLPVQSAPNNSSIPARPTYRSSVPPKYTYDYPTPNQIQTSPSRVTVKTGCQNQQTRMTVSVTSLVNEMNLTKQKRESPLDLSVKTVKNSADSSTTQDDAIDSASMKNESLLLSRSSSLPRSVSTGFSASHKVDFAPDFAQYRERERINHVYSSSPQPSHPAVRQNEVFDSTRPATEYQLDHVESRHQAFVERNKYQITTNRNEYVPRIDLTRSNCDDRLSENRLRDDRHILLEDRKRLGSTVATNIPEKLLRYETWSADSRIERMSQSAREQRELMTRPVYNYTSHKKFEAYQNDQKRSLGSSAYRDHKHGNQRGEPRQNSYSVEPPNRNMHDYHAHYHEKISSSSGRHVIQKIPNHRDTHPHFADSHNAAQPADKTVLSILRNSLETKHTNFSEPAKPNRQIPDLIVIDDVDDSVIEITDLTKENDIEAESKSTTTVNRTQITSALGHHIQMPKAVDSIAQDDQLLENSDTKRKSPENDVASRIRTKAELKVMPPSEDNSLKQDNIVQNDQTKLLPKSQKQHLFNQIREDNLRLESVIKNENIVEDSPKIKSEPMCIEEIEKDAIVPIKTEQIESANKDMPESSNNFEELDMDWASACDSFMEQLKTGCHKKKTQRKRTDTIGPEPENNLSITEPKPPESSSALSKKAEVSDLPLAITIKQEPVDNEDNTLEHSKSCMPGETPKTSKNENVLERNKNDKKLEKRSDNKIKKNKLLTRNKNKNEQTESSSNSLNAVKKEIEPTTLVIKEELESTDDDEPLIKSKILKEKEQCDRMKYQMLKDLSEKSAYVKLEYCDERVNINNRISLDSNTKDKEDKPNKSKLIKQNSKHKMKSDNLKNEKEKCLSSDSDDDALSVASRLRVRKNTKTEESKSAVIPKTPIKSPSKKGDSSSSCSTPLRKPGFGDGSDFHPGWEEELYRYKRSLRMPTRLIAIPRGRSGGPFPKNCGNQLTRGSTSLPDLDPVPLSPAPSSAQSAATDDLCRRPEKLTLDSDVESNSSCSVPNRLLYDSEASSSTVFSATKTKNDNMKSIVDVLIQKCGKKNDSKKRSKEKEEKMVKIIPKNSNELLPTPSLGLLSNDNNENLGAKKEKLMEDIFYLGAFRKETVAMFRSAFIKNTNGLIGATEEFAPVVLKSRTRTESRVLKQRATMKEVFGDDRPASAPPTSCREDFNQENEEVLLMKTKTEIKPRFKTKTKTKILRRSSSIRDGLRSTKSLKRNDAKGRMMRLKKRNSLLKSFTSKRMKEISKTKLKKCISPSEDKNNSKDENISPGTTEGNTKKRLKRLFGRRKFSSGFDYIRKKKKIIRREEGTPKVRRQAPKPTPESVHDIQKEIKGWFINKSIGETHLHRAARLGFTDCVAYCLEKMEADSSAKDNAGFTPLHVASAKGHVRIARLLLQYGANVSAAAQGGIRPLHEACENSHVEMVRLLLAYGADPLLGTYAGQTPEELAEGPAANLLRLHIEDIQGRAVEPWQFPSPCEIIDREELGCDPLSSPPPASPPPPPDSMIEIQCTDAPLPPFYSLRTASGQPADGLWVLLQDLTNLLQIKSKESLLKQIHCGSGSPKELLREIKTQEFLERAQCHQLLGAGEKVNVRASKVALIRVTDKLRQLLKIETVLVS